MQRIPNADTRKPGRVCLWPGCGTKLSTYNAEDYCSLHQSGEHPDDELVAKRFSSLFAAGRVLLTAGIAEEDLIISTLAFANWVSEPAGQRIEAARDDFDALKDNPDSRENFARRFYGKFRGLVPEDVLGDVFVVRRVPIFVETLQRKAGAPDEEIEIDVFMRSVKPGDVADLYERELLRQQMAYDPSNGGSFRWQFQSTYLSITVGPDEVSLHEAGWPVFPPPQLVGELYGALKGSTHSKKFRGFAYALGGRQSGNASLPANLIPACLVWYLRNYGQIKERRRLATLVNRYLLKGCGVPEVGVGPDHAIWRNADEVAKEILRVEESLRMGLATR